MTIKPKPQRVLIAQQMGMNIIHRQEGHLDLTSIPPALHGLMTKGLQLQRKYRYRSIVARSVTIIVVGIL